MNFVICHYSEIGLKGKNRRFFEEKLVENIKKSLEGLGYKKIKRISGRILIELKKEAKEDEIKEALKNVFGLAYFAFGVSCPQEIEAVKKKALEIFKNKFLTNYRDGVNLLGFTGREDRPFRTFKIETQRSKKDFPLTSQEINEKIGEYVLKRFKIKDLRLKINLENPELTCFIEIVEKYAFLYLEKIKGLRGLPVSASGRAISLLSGGIDSPVASFYGMRRGVKIIFLHFSAYPFTKKSSVEKVKKLVKILNKFQFQSKIYLVPFTEIQKEILLKTKVRLRVIFYRRFMFRLAEILAKKEGAKALITGESVGQVASQTLENIGVIEEVVRLPVLRPLIAMDKEDIIKKAKELGTFDISILPAQDCCQRFLPKHPATKANLKEVKKEEEEELDVGKLIKQALKKTKFVKVQ
ncbi:MAG: tRNA uracil 4-sulfurtransferase ThiI [Patescibacteria group bacterium]|nr:tRNA uracil 4-sulfurtransferase ThiI [Patescibacteria group bacterium]